MLSIRVVTGVLFVWGVGAVIFWDSRPPYEADQQQAADVEGGTAIPLDEVKKPMSSDRL